MSRLVKKKSETYTCAICGNEYEKGWSDEEALVEKDSLWGDIPIEDCAVVYDDCFRGKIMEEVENEKRKRG